MRAPRRHRVPDRAAELDGEPRPAVAQPPRPRRRGRSASPATLSPNVVGRRLLEQRAARPSACRGASRASRTSASARRSRPRRAAPPGLGGDEHQRGVEDVLARGAAVHPARGRRPLGDVAVSAGDERHRRGCRCAPPRRRARRGRAASAATAAATSAAASARRSARPAPARAASARLGVAASPRPGAVADDLVERRVAGQRRRTAAVRRGRLRRRRRRSHRSPWRRMSKRQPPSARARRSACRAPSPGQRPQHRVGRVRLRLVGEVDPGDERFSMPRAKTRDVDVRRLRPPSPTAAGPGLTVTNPNAPVVVGRRAAEPAEARGRDGPRGSSGWSKRPSGSACQVSTMPSGTGVAGAVETAGRAIHDRARRARRRRRTAPSAHGRPIAQVRADGLRRACAERLSRRRGSLSNGVWRRARAARCRTGSRAPSGRSVASWSKRETIRCAGPLVAAPS